MTFTGPQIISELREKLQFEIGRHLYGVLGSYAALARFEHEDLTYARMPDDTPFPAPVNLNAALLGNIGDADLRGLVAQEARRPHAVQSRLNQELGALLNRLLAEPDFLIVKQIEMLFAFHLDLSIFRISASNRKHVLLLLPGGRRGDQITLFQDADARFHRILTANLIADNHLWELSDG